MIAQNIIKVACQILILLFILDQIMSQCGIRWRGTCEYKSSLKTTKKLK